MKSDRRPSLAAGVLALAGIMSLQPAAAETSGLTGSETYHWSAELVALDAAAGTVTVRSSIVTNADSGMLSELEAGDPAMLTWSGVFSASGIRAIEPGSKSSYDRFSMPIEFAGTSRAGRYVDFKVRVPAGSIAGLRSLTAGQWLTFTSPHRPAGPDEVVVSVRPFTDAA